MRSRVVAAVAIAIAVLVGWRPIGQARKNVRVARAWPVMGTMLTVTVWGRDSTAMLDAVRAARDSVRLEDSLMSVYRPESEISRVNRSAGRAP